MCLNETYKVHIGKHLPDSSLIQNGERRKKKGDALLPLLSTLL
jgi:hypothetical protein